MIASIRQFSGRIAEDINQVILIQTPGAHQVREFFCASPDKEALIPRNVAFPHLRDKTQDQRLLIPTARMSVTTSGGIGSGPDFARHARDTRGMSL